MLSLSRIKCHFILTVNGIWDGGGTPLILEKFVKKKQQRQSIRFFANIVTILDNSAIFLYFFIKSFGTNQIFVKSASWSSPYKVPFSVLLIRKT